MDCLYDASSFHEPASGNNAVTWCRMEAPPRAGTAALRGRFFTVVGGVAVFLVVCGTVASAPARGRALVRCHTADLWGRLGFIQGAAGSRFGPVALANPPRQASTLFGFIGGQLYGAGGGGPPPPLVRRPPVP